jgi:hypothetical protein
LDSIKISVEQMFCNWGVFSANMSIIYQRCEFDDYDADLVKQFFDAYMDLHQ